jgi:hypothetical protein
MRERGKTETESDYFEDLVLFISKMKEEAMKKGKKRGF